MNKTSYLLRLLLGILLPCWICLPVSGQWVLRQGADQASLYNYAYAIPLYKKAYRKKPGIAAARGLAESYRRLKDYVFAESWYAKVVAMPDHTSQDELHYAAVLINNSKHAEARLVLDKYIVQQPQNKSAIIMRNGCDSAIKWMATRQRGDLVNMQTLNSAWSDWGITFQQGKIVFASDRPYDSLSKNHPFRHSNIKKSTYGWTGNSYLHLYEGNGADDSGIRLLSRRVNGDYHSASPTYSEDGRQLYYTVTNLVRKKSNFLGKENPYTINLEIKGMRRDSANSEWIPMPPFPYNKIFNYSVGDPFLVPDGQTLYFVANDGPNGMGGTDIYYCRMGADGNWMEPVNMGPDINTPGDERTPFFDREGNLYFASDGRAGMGGLDIYSAVKGQGWKVTNLGSPVNSPQDEFAPVMTADNRLYFSSNRLSGKGSDDIYCFTAARVLQLALQGYIRDKQDNPLPNAVITLENLRTGTPFKAITAADGSYHFPLDSLTDYTMSVVKTDYASLSGVTLTTKVLTTSSIIRQDFVLEKAELNKPQKLENIYFDLDKWDIRPDAATELDKLVKLLKDNPTWKVEMASHTDSRANDRYNQKLSQRRAASTVAYLTDKGIDKDRLSAKGYGETRLVNHCANGIFCSEKEHQENRRTEFTLLDK